LHNHTQPNLTVPQPNSQAFIAPYAGAARLERLMLIAGRAAGSPLAGRALALAAAELADHTDDAGRLRDVAGRLGGFAAAGIDSGAPAAAERRAAAAREALEAELATARASLDKEAIRAAHAALGAAARRAGDAAEAFRHHVRARDYCATPEHALGMAEEVLRCAVETRAWVHVPAYAAKAEAALAALPDDPAARARVAVAQGLAHLAGGRYAAAARAFAAAPAELGDTYADVAPARDVAVYGTLCALGALERAEVKSALANAAAFREHVAAAPPALGEALAAFAAARFGPALAALERLRPELERADPHLVDHLGPLLAAARARALAQYAGAFSALDLSAAAAALGAADAAALEGELAALIAAGRVAGRLDSAAGALRRGREDGAAAARGAAIRAGEAHVRAARGALLRASMVRHGMVQRGPGGGPERPDRPERGEGGRGGRRRGGGGGGERYGGERYGGGAARARSRGRGGDDAGAGAGMPLLAAGFEAADALGGAGGSADDVSMALG
jgi:COP9 signalosome complex subunit 1